MLHFIKKVLSPAQSLFGFPAKSVIIDVSKREDFENGHLETAINIPLEVLHDTLEILVRYRVPIVTVCCSGSRSEIAYDILYAMGLKVYHGGNWKKLQQKQM